MPPGYLSTGDEAATGNYGIKDNTMSLQWIQENIRHFGGDPAQVTLFGYSAGAAAVVYQLLTEKSKGRVHLS